MPATFEQKEFNNFLEQMKQEQKNIDIIWFKNESNYETPDEMLEYLHSLEISDGYNQATSLIEESFTGFEYAVEIISEGDKKTME